MFLFLQNHDTATPEITCALYLAKFSRLVCGQSNGQIAIVWAAQAATKLLLKNKKFSRSKTRHAFYECDYAIEMQTLYTLPLGAFPFIRML